MHGLTTAAGVWMTAGVGMAVGCGMYVLACGATVIIISLQCFLHLPIKAFKRKQYYQLKLIYHAEADETLQIKDIFGIERFSRLKCTNDNGRHLFEAVVNTDKYYDDMLIASIVKEKDFIISIERMEDY